MKNTQISAPFVSVLARSLHFNLRRSDIVYLLDEAHRVLVARQSEPHRIRSTTQLVDLGSGNNDANQLFLW